MAALWFVVATGGSGGNQTAKVYGPYASVAQLEEQNTNFTITGSQIIGNQGGYSTQAAAQTEANSWNSGGSHSPVPGSSASSNPIKDIVPSLPGWNLIAHGFTEYFFRGLKIVIGGVLIIVGVSKLMNVDNKITQIASKIPVIPV